MEIDNFRDENFDDEIEEGEIKGILEELLDQNMAKQSLTSVVLPPQIQRIMEL